MSILAIFLGIVVFILLFIIMLQLYNKFLKGAVIYDLKKSVDSIKVSKPTSTNYYFSCWIYVNSFDTTSVKPIFYYGEQMTVSPSENTTSNRLVYLQLSTVNPNLKYFYTTNTSQPYKSILITENLPIQRWVHVVVSTSGKIIECYLDGKLVTTINESDTILVATSASSKINIGKRTGEKPSDIFISKIQRIPTSVNAKTVNDLYMSGPGTGVNSNRSKYDIKLQLTQNDKVIKSYSTASTPKK